MYFVCLLYITRSTTAAVVYNNSGKVDEGLQELHQVLQLRYDIVIVVLLLQKGTVLNDYGQSVEVGDDVTKHEVVN